MIYLARKSLLRNEALSRKNIAFDEIFFYIDSANNKNGLPAIDR